MAVAQRLYENGFITYMRTDSVTLSDAAIAAARSQVAELYGRDYLPDRPRTYQSKVKNAQEAHEAIRPSGEHFRTPAQTGLSGDEFRLYELIWMRTVASQMKDAEGRSVSVRLGGAASTGEDVVFNASGRVITFHGFLKAYVEGRDDESDSDDRETRLPALAEGDAVNAAQLKAAGHETKPPARYTEATLIRELEEREIGRPSTYASIIGTILNRGYVYKKGTALVPAWLAFSVVRLLEEHFPRQVSYEFTASMEDELDNISRGEEDWLPMLERFWAELKKQIDDVDENVTRSDVAMERPLGIGPMVFNTFFPEDEHNIWLKSLTTYGWLGFLCYLTLVIWTLCTGFKNLLLNRPWQPYLLIAYIAFVGHSAIGFVIDTDHWRHFCLIVGIIWGCLALEHHQKKTAPLSTPSRIDTNGERPHVLPPSGP